jgi:hypothetical protein
LFSIRKQAQLSQLTVLAAAPVIETEGRLLFFGFSLASNTEPHPGDCFATRFWDCCLALLAMSQAFTDWHPASNLSYGIFHASVNLILNRPISGPTNGHD